MGVGYGEGITTGSLYVNMNGVLSPSWCARAYGDYCTSMEENKGSRRCGGVFSPCPCRHTREPSGVSGYKADRMSERFFFFYVLIVPRVCTIARWKRAPRERIVLLCAGVSLVKRERNRKIDGTREGKREKERDRNACQNHSARLARSDDMRNRSTNISETFKGEFRDDRFDCV